MSEIPNDDPYEYPKAQTPEGIAAEKALTSDLGLAWHHSLMDGSANTRAGEVITDVFTYQDERWTVVSYYVEDEDLDGWVQVVNFLPLASWRECMRRVKADEVTAETLEEALYTMGLRTSYTWLPAPDTFLGEPGDTEEPQ